VFAPLTNGRGRLLPVILVMIVAAAGLIWHVTALRLRVRVISLAVEGKIAGLDLRDAAGVIWPPSSYDLEQLIETRSAYVSMHNPFTTPTDVAVGGVTFRSQCAACHGATARGGDVGPSLVGGHRKHGDSAWAVLEVIRKGVVGTSMPPHAWSMRRLWQTIAYLDSLSRSDDLPAQSRSAAELSRTTPVSYEEIAANNNPGGDWLTYSGSYSGARHSSLAQITVDNVGALAPSWIFQFSGSVDRLEVSPIVHQGVVFASDPTTVVALDARTGEKLWEFDRPLPPEVRTCCGVVNRGLAILGNNLYFGTLDAHLIALSMRTGRVVWDVPVAHNFRAGYSITGAPLVYRNLVVTGVSCGDYATRGFIAAFDAATGKERWRFWAVPARGEPGSETWADDSWRVGGGGTWVTGSYDPKLDVLYWGVGNPAPDFDSTTRRGDNLYTNSVVALRGTTGALLWHFQFTPGDDHDWDSAQVLTLVDRANGSHQLLLANRNGFFYALDRETGQFLGAHPFVRETWATAIDASGRPLRAAGVAPSPEGVLVYPSVAGATNWWSPSYDPNLDLLFVPAIEQGGVYFSEPHRHPESGELYVDGSTSDADAGAAYSSVIAISPKDGAVTWRYRRPFRTVGDLRRGGILSTQGGLLFAAQNHLFYALNARNGKLLWSFPTGGKTSGQPISYAAAGEQYVLMAAGNALIAFSIVRDPPIDSGDSPSPSR